MALTIKKPAVIEPSHMPRTKRTAKRPAKFLQAACEQRAIAHMEILKLDNNICICICVDLREIFFVINSKKHTSSIFRLGNAEDRDSGETRKSNNSSKRLCRAFYSIKAFRKNLNEGFHKRIKKKSRTSCI